MSSTKFFQKSRQEVVKVVQNQVFRIMFLVYCISMEYIRGVIRKNERSTTFTTSNTFYKEDLKHERI